jgi:hypothetical protein
MRHGLYCLIVFLIFSVTGMNSNLYVHHSSGKLIQNKSSLFSVLLCDCRSPFYSATAILLCDCRSPLYCATAILLCDGCSAVRQPFYCATAILLCDGRSAVRLPFYILLCDGRSAVRLPFYILLCDGRSAMRQPFYCATAVLLCNCLCCTMPLLPSPCVLCVVLMWRARLAMHRYYWYGWLGGPKP